MIKVNLWALGGGGVQELTLCLNWRYFTQAGGTMFSNGFGFPGTDVNVRAGGGAEPERSVGMCSAVSLQGCPDPGSARPDKTIVHLVEVMIISKLWLSPGFHVTSLTTDQRNVPSVSEKTWVPQPESYLPSARRGQSYVWKSMCVWQVYAWEPTYVEAWGQRQVFSAVSPDLSFETRSLTEHGAEGAVS